MRAITVSLCRIQYPCVQSSADYDLRECVVCRNFKNEDTWCRMLGHYRCRIRFRPESILWLVVQKAFCIFVRNRNGNLNVPYLYLNGDQVVLNWNWLDNDWNDSNPALRFATLFISNPRVKARIGFAAPSVRTIRLTSFLYFQ